MPVRLVDLHPEWIDWEGRHGVGIRFDCLVGHCAGQCWILFANPLDGGPPLEISSHTVLHHAYESGLTPRGVPHRPSRPETRWTRTGDNFETLSMSPSVEAWECGHKTLTDGVWNP